MNKNNQKVLGRDGMTRTMLGVFVLIIPMVIAACSPSVSTPTANAPMATTVPMATDTPQMMQYTATPTPLDPCVMVNSQEASTLTGATYGEGEESTTEGGGRVCTYGSNTNNVFLVEVAQAPDVATIQAEKTQFLADLQARLQKLTSEGLNVTQMPNFADGAVMADISRNIGGTSINGRAIGVVKGTVFFGLSDLAMGGPAPTSDAMQAEAQTVIGWLQSAGY